MLTFTSACILRLQSGTEVNRLLGHKSGTTGTKIRYRTEDININSVLFLRTVYKCISGNSNQAAFILRFFSSAGCKIYKYPDKGPVRNEDYGGPRHWITDRPLNDEIRSTFPNPINKQNLFNYIRDNLICDKIRVAMDEFEFPVDTTINEDAFAWAIVEQFDAFVNADADKAEIIYQQYKNYCQLTQEQIDTLNAPSYSRYNGDSYIICSGGNNSNHKVNCYENFEHIWTLRNTGRLTWHDRKFVLTNQCAKGPRARLTEIDLPDTEAGSEIKITASYNARGFEGSFISKWIMCDEDGADCFPAKNDFEFNITVKYVPKKTEDIK